MRKRGPRQFQIGRRRRRVLRVEVRGPRVPLRIWSEQKPGTRGPVHRPVNTWYQKGTSGSRRVCYGGDPHHHVENGSEMGPPENPQGETSKGEPPKGLKGEQVLSGGSPHFPTAHNSVSASYDVENHQRTQLKGGVGGGRGYASFGGRPVLR